MWLVNAVLRPLYPWKRPGTHCLGDQVGPTDSLEGAENLAPPPGFDPWNVQPVASRCTVHFFIICFKLFLYISFIRESWYPFFGAFT